MFEKSFFIKPNSNFERSYTGKNIAPMFRKKINLRTCKNAVLYVCGLGIARYYINEIEVSDNLFTAPVSDYNKTLWYNKYDVTKLLKNGENTFAVICGNGFFNEDIPSEWSHNEASWRDLPQFIMQLDIDGKTVLTSDDTWLCKSDSAITFNDLRSGEYFDLNLYEENWKSNNYDDSQWTAPIALKRKAAFRECKCEPIRECAAISARHILKGRDNTYVFDIGQNISGYIRLHVSDGFSDSLTIRYAEQIDPDLTLNLNNMAKFYPKSPFQTDKFTGNGKAFVWSPLFVYHGFRYIEISGITDLSKVKVEGIFVHQDIRRKTTFSCSDPFLSQLFDAGVISTYSNMFYNITDCPSREKLGWTNDAQASVEQILTDFHAEKLLSKWLVDIYDSMNEEGSLPGIIPTYGWGYHWGNGPVSDGVLFEIAYRLYQHTGNTMPLIDSLPYFERYFEYLNTKMDDEGFISFGLEDWANPDSKGFIPTEFINAVLLHNFYKIAGLAAKLAKSNKEQIYNSSAVKLKTKIIDTYIDKSGYCTINEQTPVSMLILYDIYDDMEPLKNQLKTLVEKNHYRHYCGMVGMRRILHALNKCDMHEYAYKILTANGYPSYKSWFDNGATSLCESWHAEMHKDSKNHHMYSDFMSWIIKTILGIQLTPGTVGETDFTVAPYYFHDLHYAEGSYECKNGNIFVHWEKSADGLLTLVINVRGNITVRYNNRILKEGNYFYTVNKE